jgi:hypothetical protein
MSFHPNEQTGPTTRCGRCNCAEDLLKVRSSCKQSWDSDQNSRQFFSHFVLFSGLDISAFGTLIAFYCPLTIVFEEKYLKLATKEMFFAMAQVVALPSV